LLNLVALQKLNPPTASIYIYLQPVLTSIFTIASGSDTLDMNKIIAASIILIVVYLVSVRPLKSRKQKLS